MASSESQLRLTASEPAKWIVVYKNGDQHYPGRRMVVKPREIKTFDHLLEEVTVKLSPSFGAVRNIFTPEGGTRVSSLTDLKANGRYVASPNEPFRQLSKTRYADIPVQSTSQSRISLQPSKDKLQTSLRRLKAVPSRYRDAASDELTIHVYRNGDAYSPAGTFRLNRMARSHWEQTLARVGEKLQIGRGVHKLYNLRGQLVRNLATDLEHNGQYVAAADNDSFRLVNYGASLEPFQSVTRGDRSRSEASLPSVRGATRGGRRAAADRGRRPRGVSLPPAEPPQLSRGPARRQSAAGAQEERPGSEDGLAERGRQGRDEERLEDGVGDAGGGHSGSGGSGGRTGRDSAYGSDGASPEESCQFQLRESEYLKATKTPLPVVEVDLDRDSGGVYRHRSTEPAPPELPDAPDMRAELPIDLRPAQEVTEELIQI
ncbi:doublecortin domain-containing protein 2-like [Pollicipes pollicipes]|uniref:doublecortin domain-containing protein 2-like n=1 Tax=Pollicipes pollicipes TaxID=41117 RepID=UPI00188547E8|nr:doublecortin domain-containing protein 2-like [Pollicipes pollicipes]